MTEQEAATAMRAMSQWLRLRAEHEVRPGWGSLGTIDRAHFKQILLQMAADVDHSALLYRLLRGREPLPEPPPLQHSYPVYPDWPYVDEQ